jgi:DNA-binding transcriptional ArsR family regulator
LFNIASPFYRSKSLLSSTKRRSSRDRQLDRIFRALGDRTRRALLVRLARTPAIITELAKPFDMSLPAVSRHVRVLESAGLVRRSVDGRVHHCSLSPRPLKTVEAWLRHYRRFWEGKLDALARYVEDDESETRS